ncbi:MAG TPA: purine-nucleoside phosphorylase [Planctomycetes bacterium]|nr:purine-nucleoside phosphorylase [Planctomycetota bacterium]
MNDPEMIQASKEAIQACVPGFVPEAAIIFGTGLSSLAEDMDRAVSIPYEEIPHFARATVESHTGELVCGFIEGRAVVAMKGRFHRYEGYDMRAITHPVRVMHAMGAPILIASNAAGGMNPLFSVGDLCVLDDHINLLGDNPLIGPNDENLGPRFPDMSEPYDRALMSAAERIALEEGIPLHRAVYAAVTGPCLETRAEYRFLRGIGADLVGMSTVPEVIAARHESMRVIAFSIITDACFPEALKPVSVEEIIATAGRAEPKLNLIVKRLLRELDA